jgi:hypothetical protein
MIGKHKPNTHTIMTSTDTATSPTQNYWNIGLKSFNAGDSSTTGMQKIWDAMTPPVSLPLVATIVNSLWADTYWNLTGFNVTQLASDLQAALGLNPIDCQRAANRAVANWCGLLVRGNMADQGSPMPKADPVTASPDVVVNGTATITVQRLITLWNQFIYTPNPGLKNNSYGRAQSINLPVPITQPNLAMYYSDAGFNPPPSSWIQMFTTDGLNKVPLTTLAGSGPMQPGDRAANADPLMFNVPGTGHYCAISVVSTEYFTNNPGQNTGNWDTQAWIHNNGAAGWHNVDVSKSNQASLKFHNQDGVAERFAFLVDCHKLPKGTKISLACDDSGLAHPIRLDSAPTTKVHHVFSTVADVPPHFAGKLALQLDTPDGEPLPAGSAVQVRMVWHIAPGHRHYADALAQLGQTPAEGRPGPALISMGEYTFVGVPE